MTHSPSDRPRITRRAVTTATWGVPAIIAVTAAPAMAVSLPGVPTVTAAWVTDSFGTNFDGLAAGAPAADGYYGPVAVALTITGGTVSNLMCVVASAGFPEFSQGSGGQVPQRGDTTWAVDNNASLALDGWTTTQAHGVTFQNATIIHAAPAEPGTVLIRPYFEALVDRPLTSVFPFTLTFSAGGSASSPQILVNSSTSSPYITGTSTSP